MKEKEEHQATAQAATSTTKTQVVKDTLVFQVKLFGDGLRDVFLSPVSIVAALAGLIFTPSTPDYYLRKLMAFGHKTDRWLNLFGTYGQHSNTNRTTSDTYVKKVEELLIKGNQGQEAKATTKETEATAEMQQDTAQHDVSNEKPTISKPSTE
ncbi:hypothetical protein HII17_16390 [Thalassotalea sp. M1531]|uniref:Uncharacterized protein n=1 Tax=Thalassotalea algicola TaxID=2716224 RepID=A0A7Y0Q7J5_9GAMM|nr:hypothetical protein [Thalassotalea algicola]NMP33139.1 hypothetical protein [Thalassotalea algicola]